MSLHNLKALLTTVITQSSFNVSSLSIVKTHPTTTDLRKFVAFSTTSTQTLDMEDSSKSVASGNDWRASRASLRSSEQRSESSPDRQALRRKAKAKDSAVLAPTLARDAVARSFSFLTLKRQG